MGRVEEKPRGGLRRRWWKRGKNTLRRMYHRERPCPFDRSSFLRDRDRLLSHSFRSTTRKNFYDSPSPPSSWDHKLVREIIPFFHFSFSTQTFEKIWIKKLRRIRSNLLFDFRGKVVKNRRWKWRMVFDFFSKL